MDIRVISIGTLSANPLWGEREAVRTGHATTTLIQAGQRTIQSARLITSRDQTCQTA